MADRKSSKQPRGTKPNDCRPISLKGAIKVIQEKPQEEFDRLREFIEAHDLSTPTNPEY